MLTVVLSFVSLVSVYFHLDKTSKLDLNSSGSEAEDAKGTGEMDTDEVNGSFYFALIQKILFSLFNSIVFKNPTKKHVQYLF